MMEAPAFLDRAFVSPATYDAFFVIVRRLEATLAEETNALETGRHGPLAEITRQKRQGFLELNRIMRAMDGTIPSQDIIARLSSFRRALEANAGLLAIHLEAAQEVTATIMRVMRDFESDGTYSRSIGHLAYNVV